MNLDDLKTLVVRRDGWRLDVTLNRPRAKNAMSFAMLDELEAVFMTLADDTTVRVVVLRGAGGDLCAGGDVKDMAAARAASHTFDGEDPLALANRRYGRALQALEAAPQVVVVVAEGAVMGGGTGLVCAADVALCLPSARVRLPETSLGLTPAQIAPFLVRRLGLSQARRLALTGGELDAARALEIGLVHELCLDEAALQASLAAVVAQVSRCAPRALARTKRLLLGVGDATGPALDALLDRAAAEFAELARGDEAAEGTAAFIEKRPPRWAAP